MIANGDEGADANDSPVDAADIPVDASGQAPTPAGPSEESHTDEPDDVLDGSEIKLMSTAYGGEPALIWDQPIVTPPPARLPVTDSIQPDQSTDESRQVYSSSTSLTTTTGVVQLGYSPILPSGNRNKNKDAEGAASIAVTYSIPCMLAALGVYVVVFM